jgi:hypothetical protein
MSYGELYRDYWLYQGVVCENIPLELNNSKRCFVETPRYCVQSWCRDGKCLAIVYHDEAADDPLLLSISVALRVGLSSELCVNGDVPCIVFGDMDICDDKVADVVLKPLRHYKKNGSDKALIWGELSGLFHPYC